MKPLSHTLGLYNVNNKQIFVVIKPGFLSRSKDIIKYYERHGWHLAKMRTKLLLLSEAKRLYYPHKDEEWYGQLCRYMTSDLCMGLLFTKNALMKPEVFKEASALKDEIRSRWSESDMRNVIHSTDDPKRLEKERGIFF